MVAAHDRHPFHRQRNRYRRDRHGAPDGALRPGPRHPRRGDRGAGRRRVPAVGAAPEPRAAGLWHEPRHRRLPDERLCRRRPAPPHRHGRADRHQPAVHGGGRDRRRRIPGAGDQRGVHAARRSPGRPHPHQRGRPRADGGAGLRRADGGDARGIDRLQLFGGRADPADGVGRAGADRHRPLPPAPPAARAEGGDGGAPSCATIR